MTEQTTQISTIPAPADRSYHWIMTLSLPGVGTVMGADIFTPPVGCTRAQAFVAIRDAMIKTNPDFASGTVSYFSFEPNRL